MCKPGYYKRWRRIEDEWEYTSDPFAVSLYDYILCNTAWEETVVDGIKLEKGDVLINTTVIEAKRGIPVRKTRSLLANFCNKTGELSHKQTYNCKKGTVYHVVKWEQYQENQEILLDNLHADLHADLHAERQVERQVQVIENQQVNNDPLHAVLHADLHADLHAERQVNRKKENKEKVTQKENKEIKELKENNYLSLTGAGARESEEPPTEAKPPSTPTPFIPPPSDGQQTGTPRYPPNDESGVRELLGKALMAGMKATSEDASEFLDYYYSQGWRKANGNPVVDFNSAFRNWLRDKQKKEKQNANNPSTNIRGTHYVSNWDNGSSNGFKSIDEV